MMVLGVHAQILSRGVTKELAEHRKANISNVIYDLTFNIPANQDQKVSGSAVICFDLKKAEDIILDFQGGFDGSCTALIPKNKKKNKFKKVTFEPAYQNEHIIIPKNMVTEGSNRIELNFVSLDKALNRHQDYLYTIFVPDMARSVFPCFDQPDLRAMFMTKLNTPAGWKTMISDCSGPLPTHLYSFVAGNFYEKTGKREGIEMRALYRETDPDKVAQLDQIFDEAGSAIKWMEGYTGIACPFKEYGIAILPNFQLFGQEHPGAIQFNDRLLFLEKFHTQEDALYRMELIAHATAHLWFGDLVALKWFDDIWANEVFTSFAASKITHSHYDQVNFDLNFLKTHQAEAIATDRTEGTHPIAMEMTNANHASLLYDNIIFDKTAVMMRMLENMMGPDVLQNALNKYLMKYQFSNASWDDLVNMLAEEAPNLGIRQFSDVWVKQKGMPNIHTSYKGGQLVVKQTDPYNRGTFWPEKFQVRVINDLGKSVTYDIDMQQPEMSIRLPRKPDCILPNTDGRGYGRFTLDDEYVSLLPKRLITTRNDVSRYCLLLSIHDNYLRGKLPPSHFGELFRLMCREKNPLIMSTALQHMFKIVRDVNIEQRAALELCVMDLLGENKSNECHQYVIRMMTEVASSPEVLQQLETIWKRHNDPLLSESDYMNIAYRLAIMHPKRWQEILSTQRARLTNDDQRAEFDYVSRACNPDPVERTNVFNSLLKPENRVQEPWAIYTLILLNSDVFEPQSNSYIEPSLKSLEYIQQTSNVFFPEYWMKALMYGHKGREAALIVENFLKNNPDYPENLRNKALEASWVLLKQVPYVAAPVKAPAKPKSVATSTKKKK
jgi:aminopeptidase N